MNKKSKSNKKFQWISLAGLLSACGSNKQETTTVDITRPSNNSEPVAVILDTFQGPTTHGPLVLQNFYSEFLNDHKEVTVIAEDVDVDKTPDPMLRAYQDFNPDVINVSWGSVRNTDYPHMDNYNTYTHDDAYMQSNQTLWENGVTVTAAAGNDGLHDAAVATWASSIFPIVVGAYSQYDGDIYDWSNKGSAVVHYYETGDSWGIEGTSFSAPRVAAQVALIKSEHDTISESSVRTILEKNSVYDFDSGDYVQKIDEITNTDPSIDTRVKVEAVFEIFEGRNPSQTELDNWINLVDSGDETLGTMARWFAMNGIQTQDVPPIERMQAFYHYWLGRESEDSEIVAMFDDLVQTQNWNQTFDNFLELEHVDTSYSFVYNNYDVLATEVIA